ncbi:MAG TPA: ABC transporter permease subunit [Polyangiaceae bacterium]|nr:ABC transporter permease subunit [Polyangiaceae bacterium]
MLVRIGVVTLNTYREAVRARILHGLFALALGTAGYALVVGAFALRDSTRVVSDLGSASISLYAIVVAVVLGATSLYRELELKTIFPILARPLRRAEYLIGKYVGTVLTLAVFIAANSGALLLALAQLAGQETLRVVAVAVGTTALAGIFAWRLPRWRTYVPIPWSLLLLALGYWVAREAPDDRQVVLGAALLTLCEVSIVAALATVFAAFSSPFLTAVFTFGFFALGRSADTLAQLPERVFGAWIHDAGVALSKVLPNLMVYVPPRPLLTGEAANVDFRQYLLLAAAQSLGWAVLLLGLASMIFRRRDFL